MYIEKDLQGKIIIQDISQEEANILTSCFRFYLLFNPEKTHTAEKTVINVLRDIEKMY